MASILTTTPLLTHRAVACKKSRWARSTDLLIGAALLWSGVPETVVGKIVVGEIPMDVVLFLLSVACGILEAVAAGVFLRRNPLQLTSVVAVWGLLALRGYFQGTEFRWWGIDVSMFFGFPFGLFWANQRGTIAVTRIFQAWSFGFALLLLVNVFGIAAGIVPPRVEGARLYTWALFNCTNCITLILPCLIVAVGRDSSLTGSRRRSIVVAALSAMSLFGAGVFAATRSVLLEGAASLVMSYWLTSKNPFKALGWIITSAALVAAWYFWSPQNYLVERLLQTNLQEEDRFSEVELMFEDMDSPEDMWIGKGFGSRFESVVVVDGESRALSPHIGVLTTLYKGGVFAFLLIIVIPFMRALYRVCALDGSRLELAFCAGAIAYIVLSSLSGGWMFGPLFVYGASVAASTHAPHGIHRKHL